MTAANVSYWRSDRKVEPDEAQRFGFECPKGNGFCGGLLIAGRDHGIKRDGQNLNGGRAQWDMSGDPAAPTFSPSINCGCGWHGYIENGRCVDTTKNDEP